MTDGDGDEGCRLQTAPILETQPPQLEFEPANRRFTRMLRQTSRPMKRFRSLVALVTLAAITVLPVQAEQQPVIGADTSSDRSPVAPLATAVAAVTGIAISPLLGTGAYGAYLHFKTPESERDSLPWFAKFNFWAPALLIAGAVALKDAAGAALPPGWKKPLDVLETVENKISGLVAAGAVVPITMSTVSDVILAAQLGQPAAGDLTIGSGLAMLQIGAFDASWLLNLLTVPFGIAVFAVVWMASHAINVLILLSPWGAIDAALKAARTGILGLVTLASNIDPKWGAILSFVVIIISYFVAGWAFRLTVFGSIFSWDFFTRRRRRYRVDPTSNAVFSAGKLNEVPPRTYGRLVKRGESLVFVYRPWLVLPPREAVVPPAARLTVGRGMFFSLIEVEGGGLALLPPRYRTHEEAFATAYGIPAVRDAGLRRAWSWIRETMGFGGKIAPAPSA